MRRISIRTSMAVVVFAAVGLAALRNASELWAGVMVLIALSAVGGAVLGAINLRGIERAWWQGFALFSGIYLVFTLVPSLSSQLGTTPLLDYLRSQMFESAAQVLLEAELQALLSDEQQLKATLMNMQRNLRNLNSDPAVIAATNKLLKIQGKLAANKNAGPQYEHFQRIGHSLFALLAGLLGGMIAVWFRGRRERTEADQIHVG
jgi:hypothetical protein